MNQKIQLLTETKAATPAGEKWPKGRQPLSSGKQKVPMATGSMLFSSKGFLTAFWMEPFKSKILFFFNIIKVPAGVVQCKQ